MIIYLILFLTLSSFTFVESSIFYDKVIKQNVKYTRVIFFLIILFFVGLRYKVGADWLQYYSYYENVETLNNILFLPRSRSPYFFNYPWEIGFKLLCSIIKSLGLNFQALVFIISFFNIISLNNFLNNSIDKNKKLLFVILFLGFNMLREFDVLRQSISFYIMLYAYKYINKSFIKYLMICILSSLFHLSALIYLPIYLFFKFKINRTLIVTTLLVYSSNIILKLKFLKITVNFLESILPTNASSLLLHQLNIYLDLLPIYSSINFVTLISLFTLLLLLINFKNIEKLNNNYLMLFIAYIYITIFFSEVGEVQSRFTYFLSIGLVYSMTMSITFFHSFRKMAYIIFLIIYTNIKLLIPLRNEGTLLTYTPYRNYIFYFNENPTKEKEILERYNKSRELNDVFFEDQTK
ncbi:EpsG family protein [Pelobium sp.]|nr:EpsG family protein [Pelobium sp.]MDA9555548.1 EpsG family protein [Pelobium sp.]